LKRLNTQIRKTETRVRLIKVSRGSPLVVTKYFCTNIIFVQQSNYLLAHNTRKCAEI
jgi:hypothetical protein